jgi:hypothetical protein
MEEVRLAPFNGANHRGFEAHFFSAMPVPLQTNFVVKALV